jgi:hypothetical protein
MEKRFTQIGFSRELRLKWLEDTANLVLAGNDRNAIYMALDEVLQDKVAVGSNAKGNAREKTINMLIRIWRNVPLELESLRNRGLRLLEQSPVDQHVVVHFGMSIAIYPFLRVVCKNIGRLLRLQGNATTAQIQRRVFEQYGEREIVRRSAYGVTWSLVDWGLLAKGSGLGVYVPCEEQVISDLQLAFWLMEAMLHSTPSGKSSLAGILDSPALFPFKLGWIPCNLIAESEHMEVVRDGSRNELIMLKGDLDTCV